MKKLLSLIFILAFQANAQDAYQIIKRADEHLRGASQKAEMSIEVQRPKWSRTMDIKAWSLGNDYSFILISAPARDKGTVFLKREKEIWNWQPKIEKVIKLPPSMMMQSWMGSDFTNDDLVKGVLYFIRLHPRNYWRHPHTRSRLLHHSINTKTRSSSCMGQNKNLY